MMMLIHVKSAYLQKIITVIQMVYLFTAFFMAHAYIGL